MRSSTSTELQLLLKMLLFAPPPQESLLTEVEKFLRWEERLHTRRPTAGMPEDRSRSRGRTSLLLLLLHRTMLSLESVVLQDRMLFLLRRQGSLIVIREAGQMHRAIHCDPVIHPIELGQVFQDLPECLERSVELFVRSVEQKEKDGPETETGEEIPLRPEDLGFVLGPGLEEDTGPLEEILLPHHPIHALEHSQGRQGIDLVRTDVDTDPTHLTPDETAVTVHEGHTPDLEIPRISPRA